MSMLIYHFISSQKKIISKCLRSYKNYNRYTSCLNMHNFVPFASGIEIENIMLFMNYFFIHYPFAYKKLLYSHSKGLLLRGRAYASVLVLPKREFMKMCLCHKIGPCVSS